MCEDTQVNKLPLYHSPVIKPRDILFVMSANRSDPRGKISQVSWQASDDESFLKTAYQRERDSVIKPRPHLLWLVRQGKQVQAAAALVGADSSRSTNETFGISLTAGVSGAGAAFTSTIATGAAVACDCTTICSRNCSIVNTH